MEKEEDAVKNSKAYRLAREGISLFLKVNVPRSAAALSYYLILSLFPILVCLSYLLGLVPFEDADFLDGLSAFLPQSSIDMLAGYLSDIAVYRTPTLFFLALFAALAAASGAIRTLMNLMDELHGRTPHTGVRRIAYSVLLTLLYLIAVFVSIVVVLTGDWLFEALTRLLPTGFLLIDLQALRAVWQWIKYLLLFCTVLLFVLFLYRIGAPKGPPRAPVLTGGLLASAAMVVFSALFSFFIGLSSRYSLLYGSLASLILLLVWLYLCGNILISGNIVNVVWYGDKLKKRAWREP